MFTLNVRLAQMQKVDNIIKQNSKVLKQNAGDIDWEVPLIVWDGQEIY